MFLVSHEVSPQFHADNLMKNDGTSVDNCLISTDGSRSVASCPLSELSGEVNDPTCRLNFQP